MTSIPKYDIYVKSGTIFPGGGDRAMLESNLSTPPAHRGELYRFSRDVSPCLDGLKAINSPANNVNLAKPACNADLDVSSDSFPASVGLLEEYVNCRAPEITGIVAAYREHCYKLEHSPTVFLLLKHKQDGSTVLYRVNACSASRYFQQGRAQMIKNIRQRLDGTQKPGVFFHLTVDTKKYSLTDAWLSMWPEFNRFKKSLNYYRKRHMKARHGIVYLAALEPHKSDYPHLHVYSPSLRWLIKKPDLANMDKWWGMGSVKTQKELRRDSAEAYITKYISKMDGWSEVSLAMIWRHRIRIYNLSHSYRTGGESESEWELRGRYTDVKSLAKGVSMEIRDAESLLEAWADSADNMLYLTHPAQIPEPDAEKAQNGAQNVR